MICTDTALLYIPKASFTSCAKLCFGLRPSQLSFGLYQLLGLSFCKKLLNNWIFQKEVKANFQERPTILLWTQYWLEQTRKGWERRCFHGTWLYDFILKPLVSLDLFCDALVHETNSEPYVAFSAAVTEVKFKGIRMYKANEIWRVFFGQIEMIYPVFQGFWFMCLYIAFSSPTVASRLLQVTCSWRWTEDTC